MSSPTSVRRLSVDEYLDWEADQLDRHELVDGIPHAMAGAGRLHEEVAGALSCQRSDLGRDVTQIGTGRCPNP